MNVGPRAERTSTGDGWTEETPSRPWTPAAAMEPVPPLAPPPARPGGGRPVELSDRRPERQQLRLPTPLFLLVCAVLVVVLLVVIRP